MWRTVRRAKGVWLTMEISEEHLCEPGLVVFDITAADEATATQAATALGGLWLSSGPSTPWRTPGEPGVTVRAYADLRRGPLPRSGPGPSTR
ncbi:DUF6207 family protein [Streptomyces lydicamycinicus]|uniref:DUF6207 family protein n=1 Tax=Streptomyces lydicamycinicus TaxID=1546107 RepID=UPI002035FD99|nr:DUF6207 family protein [Streptomyces lydicamycinicus]URZ99439.1 DUF6207 family protein [Streptomyces lydicamycinicus]